jgi:hypothetical protein
VIQRHSRAVPAKNLGVIGQDHLRARFVAAGAAEASFRYDRQFVTVGADEPVTIVIHMASPCVDYTDRGKSSLAIGAAGMVAVAEAIIAGAESVTKEWARQRKAEERDSSEARQVMYAARPTIQQRTGRQLDDQYFTQTLLPDYMREQEVSWNVVFDDRGHFFEPHTDRSVGLGTLAVGDYLDRIGAPDFQNAGLAASSVVTCGPDGRFGAVLFIEKEGFLPLRRAARHRVCVWILSWAADTLFFQQPIKRLAVRSEHSKWIIDARTPIDPGHNLNAEMRVRSISEVPKNSGSVNPEAPTSARTAFCLAVAVRPRKVDTTSRTVRTRPRS